MTGVVKIYQPAYFHTLTVVGDVPAIDTRRLRQQGAVPTEVERPVGFRTYRVSSAGQMSIPASARQRWGMQEGGTVRIADLGFGLLLVPSGAEGSVFGRLLPASIHDDYAKDLIDDPELGSV